MKVNTKIKNAIENNKLIFFVGSGFSRDLGFPDWKNLLGSVLDDLSHDYDYCKLLKANLESDIMDVLEILDKLSVKNLKPDVLQKLDDYFQLSDENKNMLISEPNKYSNLTKISSKIITTNYDEIMETANQDLKKVTYYNGFRVTNLSQSDNFIYKLHGCMEDPSKCILFRDQYEALYDSPNKAIEELKKLIADQTVIFIGFSLSDEYVKHQFDYIYNLYEGFKGNHFLVTTEKNVQLKGIEPIELDSWNQINDFLESLMEIKKSYQEVSATSVKSVESNKLALPKVQSETIYNRPKICILIADPLDKGNLFNRSHIVKAFKNYAVYLTVDIFSINKVNSIENFDYIFIFTDSYNNKILIEDEYMISKLISLKRFEDELFQENIKGIFLFTFNEYKVGKLESLHNPYIIEKYNEGNFSSFIFKTLRKNNIDPSTIFINEEDFIMPHIEKGIYNNQQTKSRLPSEVDPKNLINFVGRRSDLETIARKCLDLEGRVLSVKASGGIGKTTIVKKVAIEFSKRNLYKDGIMFIDCEFINDFKTFEYRISQCFDIDSSISVIDYIKVNLIKKDLLLILDNFESLLNLPNEEETGAIKKLLSVICDFSSVIITTRELLGVEFEEFYDLRSLTTDEAEMLFYNYYKSKISKNERPILRELILENLLNNNPLAIKIVTSNIPNGKDMRILQKELEEDFFNTTKLDFGNIFDDKVDINIERSKSLFQSINYSYSKLNLREKLIFELLALFPDGINMVNFKKFFESRDYRKDTNKITDKEIKSLENKSLIQISNGMIKLQSIVGRFANHKFENRSLKDKKGYYNRAFEYNKYLLQFLEERYLYKGSKENRTFIKLFDFYSQNYLKCIEFIKHVEVDKYESLQYILDVCSRWIYKQSKKIITKLNDIEDFYEDLENGVLLIKIIRIRLEYYDGNFEQGLNNLRSLLPLNKVLDLYKVEEDHNTSVTIKYICNYALDIYSYKEEIKVLELAIEHDYPLQSWKLKTFLFKFGLLDSYQDYFNSKGTGFFDYDIQLSKGILNLEELQFFIDNLFDKEFTEIIQTSYIKSKAGLMRKTEVNRLVPTTPYDKGLKSLMLAFLEKDMDKAYNLYITALKDLMHINYYYVEGIYYLVKFLKLNEHNDFHEWFQLGFNKAKEGGYKYLYQKFNELNDDHLAKNIEALNLQSIDHYMNTIIKPRIEKNDYSVNTPKLIS